MICQNNVNNVTAESSSLPHTGETDPCTLKTIANHEEEKFLRAELVKKFTQPAVSRVGRLPVLPRQDEDYCIQLTRRDVVKLAGFLSIISIIGLAIAYQYFCDAPMAELNTKLKNTEKEMRAAHKCNKNNHYASLYDNYLFFTM